VPGCEGSIKVAMALPFAFALRAAFAHYDRDDIARALLATMDLFRWLAAETAEHLDYAYPALADEHATGLVRTYLSGQFRDSS
jgi:hypothetical protein